MSTAVSPRKDAFLKLFRRHNVLQEGHFVYRSGYHGSHYVNKDAIYAAPNALLVSQCAEEIASYFNDSRPLNNHNWMYGIDVVVGPATGGICLETWTAHHLSQKTNRDIRGIFAEKWEEEIALPSTRDFRMPGTSDTAVSALNKKLIEEVAEQITIHIGQKENITQNDAFRYATAILASSGYLDEADSVIVRKPAFRIQRGYETYLPEKNVLVLEDVMTTGTTTRRVIDAVRKNGGKVVGVGVIWNRGGITASDLAVWDLFSLVDEHLPQWPANECFCNE